MKSMIGTITLTSVAVLLCMSAFTGEAESFEATVRITDKVVNTVNPLIFGDNIEWTHDGMGFWLPEQKKLDEKLMGYIREVGVTHLRYPGGTLSDYFDWYKAVGSVRAPVTNCWSDPERGVPEYPHFGPEEFAAMCRELGISGTITLNSGSGTVDDAVTWIKYYEARDFDVTAYALGNELYIEEHRATVPSIPVEKTADEYSDMYLEIAKAVEEAGLDVKLGVIGTEDFPEWTKTVLKRTAGKADFLTIHNGYAPMLRVSGFTPDAPLLPEETFVKGFAGAAVSVKKYINEVKGWMEEILPNGGRDVELHMTEYGPLVYPLGDESRLLEDMMWNRTLLGALFLATEFNVFLSEPKLKSANHLPLCQGGWGSLFAVGGEYPNRIYLRNIVYYVFDMYSHLAGRDVLETEISAPTYSADAVGNVGNLKDVPYIDAGAYRTGDGDVFSLFLVNRDMNRDATVAVNPGFEPFKVVSITRLEGDSYRAENSVEDPDNVVPATEEVNETLKSGTFSVTLPKHSLARVDIRK